MRTAAAARLVRDELVPYPLQVGRRVIHDGTGKAGKIVTQPNAASTHVLVLFDGADAPVPVHPGMIEYLEAA